MSEFTKEDFVRSLENFVLMNDENFSVALRSLNDDFYVLLIRIYQDIRHIQVKYPLKII